MIEQKAQVLEPTRSRARLMDILREETVKRTIAATAYTALERADWKVKPHGWELHQTLVITLRSRDNDAIRDTRAIERLLGRHVEGMAVAIVRGEQ